MFIIIDGKKVPFSHSDKNIVEAADRAGIGIPAPCYRKKPRTCCCQVCVVEIDNTQSYACCTKPQEGMNIILHRDDLDNLRKERVKAYRENPGQGSCLCNCGADSSDGECCC